MKIIYIDQCYFNCPNSDVLSCLKDLQFLTNFSLRMRKDPIKIKPSTITSLVHL